MAHFGLDIGSSTIKAAFLEKKGNKWELKVAASCPNPLTGFMSDSEKDLAPLAEAIKKLKNEAKISTNSVISSLPERRIYTQITEMPKMKEAELAKAVPWEAESLIPQPLAEVNLDWEVINDKKAEEAGKTKIFLIAAPKTLVNNYLKVLKMAGLEPIALETELLAISRAIGPLLGQKSALVLNIGEKSSDLLILKDGNFFMSRSFSSSGEAISRAIGINLNLDLPVAEEYKKTYGLGAEFEGKLSLAIEPVLTVLTNEIKKAIHFYEENQGERLSLLILSGGTSLLPGIAEYFTKALGIEIQVADPLSFVSSSQQIVSQLKKDAPLYAVAIGLGMREM